MARATSEVLANDHFPTLLRHCLAPKHPTTPSHCCSSSDYYSVHARFTTNRIPVASRKRSLLVRQGAHGVNQQRYSVKKCDRTWPLEQPHKLHLGSETKKIALPDFLLPASRLCDIAPDKRFTERTLEVGWMRTVHKCATPDAFLPKQVPVAPPLPESTQVNGVKNEVKYDVFSLATNHEKDIRCAERDPEHTDRATPAQLSCVLLKLREELPSFFCNRFSSDLYEQNLVFENRLTPFTCTLRGLTGYSLFLNVSRLFIIMLYSRAEFNLIKITKDIEESKIEARWKMEGAPRTRKSHKRIILEGFSTFEVNNNGRICRHVMDKIMRAPKEERQMLSWIVQLGVVVGLVPKPSEAEPA